MPAGGASDGCIPAHTRGGRIVLNCGGGNTLTASAINDTNFAI
jgi:hypothetical protein